jgi:hypothetical protein
MKDVPFYRTSMQGFVAVTHAHARLWAKHIGKGSTDPLPYLTPTLRFIVVKETCFLLARNTCHLINFRQYQSPDLFNMRARSIGPFKKAKGGFTHIFIVVDKFRMWIEAKPAASITAAKLVEFIKKILYRVGVPNNIITGNGTQFTMREFKDFCADSGIKITYTSVSHPQSNRQVERSNGMILQHLKPRIFDKLKPYAGKWVKEFPSVL